MDNNTLKSSLQLNVILESIPNDKIAGVAKIIKETNLWTLEKLRTELLHCPTEVILTRAQIEELRKMDVKMSIDG
jgi:hypothetical protein